MIIEFHSIYVGTNGYLDSLDVDKVRPFLSGFRAFIASDYARFNQILAETQTFTPEAEALLKEAVGQYKASI